MTDLSYRMKDELRHELVIFVSARTRQLTTNVTQTEKQKMKIKTSFFKDHQKSMVTLQFASSPV